MVWNAIAVGLIVGIITSVINLSAHFAAEAYEPLDNEIWAKYRWLVQATRSSGVYTALGIVFFLTSITAWINGIDGFWQYLAALFAAALIWGSHWIIFHFGMNRGCKYWKTQIKQLYAYSTGILVSVAIAAVIAGFIILFPSGGNLGFYQLTQTSLDIIISLSISAALGTWLEHRRLKKLHGIAKQSAQTLVPEKINHLSAR
jgi:hypothetical protein